MPRRGSKRCDRRSCFLRLRGVNRACACATPRPASRCTVRTASRQHGRRLWPVRRIRPPRPRRFHPAAGWRRHTTRSVRRTVLRLPGRASPLRVRGPPPCSFPGVFTPCPPPRMSRSLARARWRRVRPTLPALSSRVPRVHSGGLDLCTRHCVDPSVCGERRPHPWPGAYFPNRASERARLHHPHVHPAGRAPTAGTNTCHRLLLPPGRPAARPGRHPVSRVARPRSTVVPHSSSPFWWHRCVDSRLGLRSVFAPHPMGRGRGPTRGRLRLPLLPAAPAVALRRTRLRRPPRLPL